MDKFKTAFIAHAPDADSSRDRCQIETGLSKLSVRLVSSQAEALENARKLVEEEGVQSIVLCPGFSNLDVAEIQKAVEGKAAVCAARGDGPGSKITMAAMEKAGWFHR
ncbi:MAG: DUF6506 family protein [Acidobacteriota bacterium]|nr:DUF6506 family protein [Acidobacteriota bacterium]